MKFKNILLVLAIAAMPLLISCADGADAFDVSQNQNPDGVDGDYTYTQDHITDLACDDLTPCPEELECWSLDGVEGFALCVDPYPEDWFCEEGDEPIVFMSSPPILQCDDGDDEGEGDGDGDGDGDDADFNYVTDHITDLTCDAQTPCPEELSCWAMDGIDGGALCVDPNPDQWFCGEGTEPVMTTSQPPSISCIEVNENVSDRTCAADSDCLGAGESCWILPDLGARCVTGNPMQWYTCDDDYFAMKFFGTPPELRCFTTID